VTRLLLLCSPELHGDDVARVQTSLAGHGLDCGIVDGVYGPTTAAAVRRFQRARGLRVDGIAGPQTLAALAGPVAPLPEHLPGREPPGFLALKWVEQLVGMKEEPRDSNHCPITDEFGIGDVRWCMETVSLAFKHGANLILGEGPGLRPWGYWQGRGFAYVPAFEAWAKTRGFWLGRIANPQPGDVPCYAFGGMTAVHTGIVREILGQGAFTAIEGNTGTTSDANGGEVLERIRHTRDALGFARIVWQAT
jgi:hypothetical protein